MDSKSILSARNLTTVSFWPSLPHTPLTSTHAFADTLGGSWKWLLEIHPPGKKLNYSFLLTLPPRPPNTNKRAHTRTRSTQYSKWRFLGTGVGINNAHLYFLRLVYYFPPSPITKLTPDFQTRGYDEWAFFYAGVCAQEFSGSTL